ncbi:CBS domain-containing protein [Methylococcus sp. EFPC2]|uniref:CBS domain-containing protein n=1 Tax=Methylococcus sp. EFPC2 TaxID=2812648 RepID=UPI0019674C64|nr:CBS domain-containing protein [Methylococcus sp. EFPC2]QSA97441.1 CBS domain-containing protein [Methylococcus sp. EFPC2]
MSVGQFCNRETVIVRKQDSIVEAAKLMREHHVGSIVVVEDSKGVVAPVGILTDRDLVIEILAAELNPDEVAVGDIMSYELLTARASDGLWETLQRMRGKGVRRVPVVDEQGGLAGIISSDDLLEILAGELGELTKLIAREQQREQRVRPPV